MANARAYRSREAIFISIMADMTNNVRFRGSGCESLLVLLFSAVSLFSVPTIRTMRGNFFLSLTPGKKVRECATAYSQISSLFSEVGAFDTKSSRR